MRSAKDTKLIRTTLLEWYRKTAREFPWRVDDPDPYLVFVSEVMLQQTQAARVAELLPPFLEQYPDPEALAKATNADVVRSWKGLGYNNRAIRLRNAMRAIVKDHEGNIPRDEEQLIALPGIGPYASASITCFAYNTYTIVIDVNVRRVYSRLLEPLPTTADVLPDSPVRHFANSLVPEADASEFHHAVMDLGAQICTARRPDCMACPLQELCPSAGKMEEAVRKKPKERQLRGEPLRIWRGRMDSC